MLLGPLLCGVATVNAALLTDKQGISVKQEDVDDLLKPAPEKAQLGLLKNKERFVEKLQQIYLTKAIAEQEKQQPLSADEQADFDKMVANFQFQRKLKQLTTENLPDFEPLTKLQYEAHKAEYINPEMVAVEHILIDAKKHKGKDALKIANDLIAQIKKGGDFGALAEKYSDDPSAKVNKGKLGLFSKGKMIGEFEDAAFALKLNEISKPVETTFGYHVIRKYEHKMATPKVYADVKDELTERVKQEYIQNRVKEYFEAVKKDNAVAVDDKAVDAYMAEKTKQLEAKQPAETPAVSAEPNNR